ncbi:MAG: DHH family phosphoesterase [Deltaproteobacteria bacterium]|jgi:nanoRNase/pAp phosphatase (c-di-AMP/oligoRNAs hydrolase)|nr:DHH family phosphoesterase [Deltaproteobacteria bacterium]
MPKDQKSGKAPRAEAKEREKDTDKAPEAARHRRDAHSHSTRLAGLLKSFSRDDRLLILITADPDSIASAAALKRILWRKVAHVYVASTNEVRRPDNLRLIEALGLKLPLVTQLDLSEFTKFAIVDSQPSHNPLFEQVAFSAIIDHHPVCTSEPQEGHAHVFMDIRPEWGATASIMVNYLRAAHIKPNKILATALFYAIKTDTQNFVRQGELEDIEAFRWLFPLIHQPLLTEIEMAPIDRGSFDVVKRSLAQTTIRKQYAFVFVEDLDHPDTLVIIADFVMLVQGVNRAVISGVFDNRLIIVLRSAGLRANLGKLAFDAFGDYGSAGGHKNMARAELSLDSLPATVSRTPAALSRFILKRLKDNLPGKRHPEKAPEE